VSTSDGWGINRQIKQCISTISEQEDGTHNCMTTVTTALAK